MSLFVESLVQQFKAHSQPEAAQKMAGYMKNHFEFFGVDAKLRQNLFKTALKAEGRRDYAWVLETVQALWVQPQRECHYCAIELLRQHPKHYQKDDIHLFERLVTENAWWDSVDPMAAHVIGGYFRQYPEQIEPYTEKWMESGHLWQQRSSLIFQLFYKSDTNTQLLSDYILVLAEDKRFFIQKAIGWALRQYAKTAPQWVQHFVENHTLKPLSKREALKHLS